MDEIIDARKEYDRQLYRIFYREWKRGNKFVVLQTEVQEKKGKRNYRATYKAYKKLPKDYDIALKMGIKIYDFTEWTDDRWQAMKAKLWG